MIESWLAVGKDIDALVNLRVTLCIFEIYLSACADMYENIHMQRRESTGGAAALSRQWSVYFCRFYLPASLTKLEEA
jgi:hypothetical protein